MKELKAKGDDITLFDQQLEMERQKGMELQQQIMQLELSFNANDIQKELHTLQDKDKDIKTVSNKHEQIKLHCAVMVRLYNTVFTKCNDQNVRNFRKCIYLFALSAKYFINATKI